METGAGETAVDESSVARGGEVEPLIPTTPADCEVRLEPVSAASTRLEWSPKRGVIVRGAEAALPREIGLALEPASAGGSEGWPTPLIEPWATEFDEGVLAFTPLGCDVVKSDRVNPRFSPAVELDETASLDRDPNAPASMPTPEARALAQ
jgi:hypothetical protein